jgi:hypothetical protein
LGNVRARKSGKYFLPKNPEMKVVFMATWHEANLKFASQILGRHQDEVSNIHWDIVVDGRIPPGERGRFRRYYTNDKRKRRYSQHECFPAGHVVGINCVVPQTISDDDLIALMNLAGKYKGLSPWKPGEFGHFEVESIHARRPEIPNRGGALTEITEKALKKQTE